jgi:hypothetical protein
VSFGIDGPILLPLAESELDPDTPLADLAPQPEEVIKITRSVPAVAPAPPAYSISLMLGVVPCVGLFALPPTATLAEAEAALREPWNSRCSTFALTKSRLFRRPRRWEPLTTRCIR